MNYSVRFPVSVVKQTSVCDCCGSRAWVPCFSDNCFTLGQCQVCHLLYVGDMPSLQTRMTEMETGHFAEGAQMVLDAEKQNAAEKLRHEVFSSYVTMVQKHAGQGHWLDIGCGAGHLLQVARTEGFSVEGIELTDARREVARSSGAVVHDRPVEALGLAAGSFDVISMIDVFSHLTSPRTTLTELHRLLRPGGVILLATGEVTAPPTKHNVHSWNLGDHLTFLGEDTMSRYAERVGLSIIAHYRTWLPSDTYSAARFKINGRSRLRNTMKWAVLHTPGALPLVRSVMLRRHANNPIYSGIFVLGSALPSSV